MVTKERDFQIIRNGQASLVFNKEYVTSLIERTNGIFTIYLKDRFDEYIDDPNTPINNPLRYKITFDNGVLNFIGPY